jgi:hypothetical protein
VTLTLDHVIIRAADPAEALAELAGRGGLPVLAAVQEVGGMHSGIARAGAIDVELLRIGRDDPPRPHGYGLGFTSDGDLEEASRELRALGFPTSAPARAAADGRAWRAVQVHGLLPDPFPLPTSAKPPGVGDRLTGGLAGVLSKVPAVAKAATRDAGGSMVVLTDYEFDAAQWRAGAGSGPEVLEVHVNTDTHLTDWQRVPLAEDMLLRFSDDGPAGVTRIVLEGEREGFAVGDVTIEFRSR